MTKDERLADFEQRLLSGMSPELIGWLRDAFSRGYDQGWADGCVEGALLDKSISEEGVRA